MKPTLKAAIVGLPLLLTPSPLLAEAGHLPGTPGQVHTSFNSTAKRLKLPQRMALKDCSQEVARTCTFVVSGNMSAIAKSVNGVLDQLESVTVIYAGGGNSTDLIITTGLLMIVYSPGSQPNDRTTAINTLVKGALAKEEDNSVVMEGIKYTLQDNEMLGIWFIVQPVDK